jgi:SAM-dependent methyltransferase
MDDQTSYDPERFEALFAAENRHFWFRARNRLILSVFASATAELPTGYRALEIGCGTGYVLGALEKTFRNGSFYGMDLFMDGLKYARTRVECPLVCGDVGRPPFSEPFDVIGLFDVLEHLDDDRQVLRDISSLLSPSGALLLTVPGHSSLWSYADEAAHHRRRYSESQLRDRLQEARFKVEYLTPFMGVLYPLMKTRRKMASMFGNYKKGEMEKAIKLSTGELKTVPWVNECLYHILSLETLWAKNRKRLPAGTSYLALARKS